MPETNACYIVQTVYQLLIAVCIKASEPEQTADIILTSHTPFFKKIFESKHLEQFFRNVYYAEYENSNKLKVYLAAVFQPEKNIYKKTKQKLDCTKYSALYAFNMDQLFCSVYAIASRNHKVEVFSIEDGMISYLRNNPIIGKKQRIVGKILRALGKTDVIVFDYTVLLLHPELYVGENIHTIKKINFEILYDPDVLGSLNKIFDFVPQTIEPKYIFLEEAVDLIEDVDQYYNEISIIAEKVGTENFAIKRHPRNKNQISESITVLDIKAPWELLCINNLLQDKTIISVSSTATTNTVLLSKNKPTSILLFRCIKSHTKILEEPNFNRYMNLLASVCSELHIANSIEEIGLYQGK